MRPGSVAALSVLVGWLALSALASHSPPPVQRTANARSTASAGPAPSSAALVAMRAGQPIDLNTATVADFELLPGVGPRLAARIAEARRERGGVFDSIADLQAVSGIGPAKLERIARVACAGESCNDRSRAPAAGLTDRR